MAKLMKASLTFAASSRASGPPPVMLADRRSLEQQGIFA
jgi:hypothetical protein